MNIMPAENNPMMAEVMNMLEAEPASSPDAAPGPDIPSLRERLAILVSTGKGKEAIGVNLTHDQVRQLEEKDVMRHYNVIYFILFYFLNFARFSGREAATA